MSVGSKKRVLGVDVWCIN